MKRLVSENTRVRISEVLYEPGMPRESYVRPTDQIVVFLDDCEFERVDGVTGQRVQRARKSGETLWHGKGEIAPVLTNCGPCAFRTLVIELIE